MSPKIGTIARRNRGGVPPPMRTRRKAAAVPNMPINELISTNLLPKRAAVGATDITTAMITWSSMASIGVMNVIIVIGGGGGVVRKMMRDDEIAQQEEARNMTKKGEGGGAERSVKVHTTETHIIPTPRTPRAKAITLLLLRRRPFRRCRATFIGTKTKEGRGRMSQKEATRGR